jgi:molybdopterin synthase sulfur carrier subunit
VQVQVRLPGALRPYADGRAELSVELPEGATVGTLLDRLAAVAPALERRLRDERGGLRRYVNVYLDGDDVRGSGLLATPLHDGAQLLVVPAVAGGAARTAAGTTAPGRPEVMRSPARSTTMPW